MNRHRPYTPDPDQMALWPDASGNAINGLGETAFRRPDYVYWRDPASHVFGPVQRWFYQHNTDPELAAGRAERMAEEKMPVPPVGGTPPDRSAADWSNAIKAKAAELGVEAVGIARLDPAWAFAEVEVPWRNIIVLGLAMDPAQMAAAPAPSAGAHVVREYTRGMRASKALAGWLRAQGIPADPEHGPFASEITLIPAAIAAGLGELGKHGSVINRDLGSCFRLAAVLTDLDLVPDGPDDFGADSFCTHCQVCANACPPEAILHEKQDVRGARKWYVDFDKCLPYFNETAGCGICITVCPFSRPGVGANLVAKLARRAAKAG